MTTNKSNIEAAFMAFAEQYELHLNRVHIYRNYLSLSGAIKALKILETLIGGEILKGKKVLRTHTTDYIIERSEGRFHIREKVRNDFIVERVKACLNIYG